MKIEWRIGLVVKGENEAEWAILRAVYDAYGPPEEPFVEQEDDFGSDELDFVDPTATQEVSDAGN